MDKIECPHCHQTFELTETLAGPLVAQARHEADAAATARIAAAKKVIEAEAVQRAQILTNDALSAAESKAATAVQAANAAAEQLRANDARLATALAAQATAERLQRELADERRELALTIERETAAGVSKAREAADAAAEARLGLKLAERDQQLASMTKTIEDLRRKAEQGSQQTQGEAQELALEAALGARFPVDRLEPVGKGVAGADCLQVVVDAGLTVCGRILWESKQTKNWSDAWLPKLRDDGRASKADLLVIVTVALPKGVETFDLVGGVWVTAPRYAVALAVALRTALVETTNARVASAGAETKAVVVYDYLVGPRFKARVGAIVEAFSAMREDLEAERRALTKLWAKREAQLERVMQGTAGMYGDLQAIAGKPLAELEGLDVAALSAPKK